MYPTIEDIERAIQWGIKRNDFYAYVLSCLDRTIDEEAESPCFVRLDTNKPSWTLVVNPHLFKRLAYASPGFGREKLLYAILLHEFFHLARDHFERSEEYKVDYSMHDINIAADLAINCTMPYSAQLRETGGLFPDQFGFPEGLSMEEYLKKIKENTERNGQIPYDKKGIPEDDRDNKKKERKKPYIKPKRQKSELQKHPDVAITMKEIEQIENDGSPLKQGSDEEKSNIPFKNIPTMATGALKTDLKKMIENLKKFGLDIENSRDRNFGIGSGGFEWLIDWIFKEAKISWKKLLKNSLFGNTRSREWYRSFRRTHPRSDSGILLKGKYPYKTEKVLVLLDTSGSMGQEDYQQFFGILNSLKKDGIEAFVSQWDYGKLHMEPTPLATYLRHYYAQITGGGGTDMSAGVSYVHEHYPDFQRVIVVTDGGTPYFTEDNPSPVPVIWLITEDYADLENADGTVIYLK